MHVVFWIATGIVIGLTFGWGSRRVVGRALGLQTAPSAPGAAPDLSALLAGLGELSWRSCWHGSPATSSGPSASTPIPSSY